MTGVAWSQEQVALVRAHYGRRPAAVIAAEVGRSESAVRNQGARMGLRTGCWHEWTMADLSYLRQAYPRRGALFVALQLRRSLDAVRAKAAELGVARDLKRAGLNRNGHRLWTADEDDRLVACAPRDLDALARELCRTPKAVRVRRSRVMRRVMLAGLAQGP